MSKLDDAINEYNTARERLITSQNVHRQGVQMAEKAAADIKRAQAPFKAAAERLAQLLHADAAGIAGYRGNPYLPTEPPEPPVAVPPLGGEQPSPRFYPDQVETSQLESKS